MEEKHLRDATCTIHYAHSQNSSYLKLSEFINNAYDHEMKIYVSNKGIKKEDCDRRAKLKA